ncbi:MCE family protein [Pseudonocardia spirodelae]|uniref:MCE family protein n=1 Tax=Pseudonocardia spirodelae TaxID=3133431 RepID=A0ABU8T652_9PSEU
MSSTENATRKRMVSLLAMLLVAAMVAAVAVVLLSGGTRSGSAYFASVKNLYAGDTVRILGVRVGTIDAVVPEGDRVRVDFTYDADHKVPADTGAAIISPTLVSTRFLQLAPAYTGGPEFADGATIPIEKTASPMEFDDLKKQLGRLSTELGPDGANRDGSLSRALDVTAQNAQGQGDRFRTTISELSRAVDTLSQGRGDLFGTVRNLQVFVSALSTSQDQIVEFNQRLASVSDILASNRTQLATALSEFDALAGEVQTFVGDNRGRIGQTVDQAGQVSRALAEQRDDIALALQVAGPAIQNFYNTYAVGGNAVTGYLNVPNLRNPGQFVCSGIAAAAASNPEEATNACQTYLGPLAQMLAVQQPPIGINPLTRRGGGVAPSTLPDDTTGSPAPSPEQNVSPIPGQGGNGAVPDLGGLLTPGGGR